MHGRWVQRFCQHDETMSKKRDRRKLFPPRKASMYPRPTFDYSTKIACRVRALFAAERVSRSPRKIRYWGSLSVRASSYTDGTRRRGITDDERREGTGRHGDCLANVEKSPCPDFTRGNLFPFSRFAFPPYLLLPFPSALHPPFSTVGCR